MTLSLANIGVDWDTVVPYLERVLMVPDNMGISSCRYKLNSLSVTVIGNANGCEARVNFDSEFNISNVEFYFQNNFITKFEKASLGSLEKSWLKIQVMFEKFRNVRLHWICPRNMTEMELAMIRSTLSNARSKRRTFMEQLFLLHQYCLDERLGFPKIPYGQVHKFLVEVLKPSRGVVFEVERERFPNVLRIKISGLKPDLEVCVDLNKTKFEFVRFFYRGQLLSDPVVVDNIDASDQFWTCLRSVFEEQKNAYLIAQRNLGIYRMLARIGVIGRRELPCNTVSARRGD